MRVRFPSVLDSIEQPQHDQRDDGESQERSQRTQKLSENPEDAADDFQHEPDHDEDEHDLQQVFDFQFPTSVPGIGRRIRRPYPPILKCLRAR